MSTSSGILTTSRETDAVCYHCGYDGEVEEIIDPETRWSGWDCPGCDRQHETVFPEEGDE